MKGLRDLTENLREDSRCVSRKREEARRKYKSYIQYIYNYLCQLARY